MVAVYFATNRNPNRKRNPNEFGREFSEDGLSALRFGWAELDDDLKVREIHVADERLTTEPKRQRLGSEETFRHLRAKMAKHSRDVVVFVHGYNVKFHEALTAAARLKQNFGRGAQRVNVVLFSWPSDGLAVPYVSYWNDRQDAEASGRAFARGFLKLAEFLGGAAPEEECAQRLHLVAHSMGNYVLRHALQELRRQPVQVNLGYRREDGGPRRMVTAYLPRLFDEIFLMAADEDDDAFEHDHKLALLPKVARRVNVYFNRGDAAMGISDLTKANPDRLGADGPRNPRMVPGKVSLIDCSDVVGGLVEHSYFIDDDEVPEDMRRVLAGVDPAQNDLRVYEHEKRSWILQRPRT